MSEAVAPRRMEAAPAPMAMRAARSTTPLAAAFAAARPAAAPVAPSMAPAASFADAQIADEERASLQVGAESEVPQPASLERTAPFGAPKFEGGGTRQPGDPSPEALRRLQAAVQSVPKAAPMVRQIAPQPRDQERPGRLTINGLIHKMTGQGARDNAAASRRPAESEQLAPAAAEYEETERERVDIPAFLRRQAN
jgi:cell division protein FtsZ